MLLNMNKCGRGITVTAINAGNSCLGATHFDSRHTVSGCCLGLTTLGGLGRDMDPRGIYGRSGGVTFLRPAQEVSQYRHMNS